MRRNVRKKEKRGKKWKFKSALPFAKDFKLANMKIILQIFQYAFGTVDALAYMYIMPFIWANRELSAPLLL